MLYEYSCANTFFVKPKVGKEGKEGIGVRGRSETSLQASSGRGNTFQIEQGISLGDFVCLF